MHCFYDFFILLRLFFFIVIGGYFSMRVVIISTLSHAVRLNLIQYAFNIKDIRLSHCCYL